MPTPPVVIVRLERAGRGGKSVTLVEGIPAHPEGLASLLKTLKMRLGVGGTVAGRALELQGDLRDRLCALLPSMGFSPRRGN